jgi:hypothetical protein
MAKDGNTNDNWSADLDAEWDVEWEDADEGSSVVRPFLMTMGRTVATGPPTYPETMVVARDLAISGVDLLTFEHQSITRLACEPLSVAEISAKLRIPLGAALVLVSDMRGEGLLDASASIRTAGTDVLRRIRGRIERIGK